ncbi:MAG: DNA-binding protein [Chloroflexi bacterium RBG_13_52_14]|nr:MAG: DNA-binding protein [Chloroflexi bacterium RBG_13_52_14]
MREWTFLTSHALVLSFIAKQPRITGIELATAVGITERATRKIIADLEAEGYIAKKKEGRRIKYRIDPDLPMRHEIYQDTAIGDFLKALGWRSKQAQR